MDEIKVILADGTELYFPLGTDDAIIDAKVKEVVSGQSQDPVATERREPIGLGAQAALSATQAGFDALGGESTRAQKANEIFASTLKGDQSVSEAVTQAYGQGFASLGDLIGKGVGLIGEGVSRMTPDVIEDEVMNQLGIFFDQPLMQAGKEAIAAGGEAWDQFSQENPRAARNIEAVVNISGATGLGGLGKQSAGRYARTYEPAKARVARENIEGGGTTATRNTTAPYRLEQIEGAEPTIVSERGPLPAPAVPTRAVKNPAQQAAIKQGFDEGTIAMIRETNPADRKDMLESLKILKEAGENTRYRLLERSTDVVGGSMMKRYNLMKRKNTQAGSQIDNYAKKNMANEYVEFSGPVNNFKNNLEDMGIKINDDFTLDFSKATITGLKDLEGFLSRVVERMASSRDMTAAEVHSFKRFIDAQVGYGKVQQGLSGQTESVVKQLRAELDQLLDNRFPEYDRLNTTYAETIEAMDEFQGAVGRGIDLDSKYAGSAVGTTLRGLSSNTQRRTKLLQSLDDMETLSEKYGLPFDDDVIGQTAFTIDMDRVFGTKADTSLAGVFGEAVATAPTSPSQFVSATARAAANKLRGVNQEKQFEAMENLLKSFEPSN
jgi:hypothetical protein